MTSEGAAPPHPRGTGLVAAVVATLSVQALGAWAMLALAAIAPIVAQSFDVPAVLIGYQIAIIYAFATGASLITGALVIRWGACRVGQISVLGCGLGCLIATIPSLYTIAFASVILGLSYGLTNPSSTHLLARYTKPENRSLVFSIKQTGVPIGGIAAGLLTPWAAVTWGWQAGVGILVPVAVLIALAMSRPRPVWDKDRIPGNPIAASTVSGVREVYSNPVLRWFCISGFFFSIIQLCLMTFIVSLAITELGFGAILAGSLLATLQASGVVGRLAWGYLADRLQRNSAVLIAISVITALCCVVVATLTPETPHWVIFGLAAVFGASAVGWNGVYIAEAVRLSPPGMIGRVSGVASFSKFGGVLVGPLVFVQIYGLLDSYSYSFGLLLVPALAGIHAVVLTRRHETAQREDSQSPAVGA